VTGMVNELKCWAGWGKCRATGMRGNVPGLFGGRLVQGPWEMVVSIFGRGCSNIPRGTFIVAERENTVFSRCPDRPGNQTPDGLNPVVPCTERNPEMRPCGNTRLTMAPV
jgi:hypothetical protein